MSQVTFSEQARSDRRAITAHTVQQFGSAQARRFRDRLETVFALLAVAPNIGRLHPELDPPGKCFRYFPVLRTFILVYVATEGGVLILRIVHGARLLARELDENPGEDE